MTICHSPQAGAVLPKLLPAVTHSSSIVDSDPMLNSLGVYLEAPRDCFWVALSLWPSLLAVKSLLEATIDFQKLLLGCFCGLRSLLQGILRPAEDKRVGCELGANRKWSLRALRKALSWIIEHEVTNCTVKHLWGQSIQFGETLGSSIKLGLNIHTWI